MVQGQKAVQHEKNRQIAGQAGQPGLLSTLMVKSKSSRVGLAEQIAARGHPCCCSDRLVEHSESVQTFPSPPAIQSLQAVYYWLTAKSKSTHATPIL